MENHSIKCSVSTCKHHDSKNNCKLTGVAIGNSKIGANCAHDTECASFEK